MQNKYHSEVLAAIKGHAGKATQSAFDDKYMGNTHPRYAIKAPVLRLIAKNKMKAWRNLPASEICALLSNLIEGDSSTEKCMAGILMDYLSSSQRTFHPKIFDQWLKYLEGWAEVDSVCTGPYTIHQLPGDWERWQPILKKFAISKNINKRRASLVLFCSPLRHSNDKRLVESALKNVETLKSETDIRITKAISWVLCSMVKLHKREVSEYMNLEGASLPAIARRETLVKIKTGRKGVKKM